MNDWSRILVATLTALLAALLVGAWPVLAGVVLKGEETRGEGGGKTPIAMYFDKNKLRIDSAEGGVIYRGDLKKMMMISTADRSYSEMSEADRKKMKAQIEQAMRQMREQMRSMPPEQRKMIEEMMKNQPGGPGGPGAPGGSKITYKKVGAGVKAGKWKCDNFAGFKNGVKVSEDCIVRLSVLGLKASDLAVMEAMEKFLDFGGADADISLSPEAIKRIAGYRGFPVRSIEYAEDGSVESTMLLKSVKRMRIPASTFDAPQGYKKTASPMAQ